MSRTIEEILPPVEELKEMEPEEIGPFLLEYLNEQCDEGGSNQFNRYNLTHTSNLERYYDKNQVHIVAKIITEAWVWLERECLLAPNPDDSSGNWVFITRRGEKLKNLTDFRKYNFGNLLPPGNLDPVLSQKVRPTFLRGDNETAIFQVFKEVEVRTRKASNLPETEIGVKLMRKAFDAKSGPLTDHEATPAEKEAMSHLFAGAIGVFKNPTSHRDIDYNNPLEVAEIILFANYLLRVIDYRKGD